MWCNTVLVEDQNARTKLKAVFDVSNRRDVNVNEALQPGPLKPEGWLCVTEALILESEGSEAEGEEMQRRWLDIIFEDDAFIQKVKELEHAFALVKHVRHVEAVKYAATECPRVKVPICGAPAFFGQEMQSRGGGF